MNSIFIASAKLQKRRYTVKICVNFATDMQEAPMEISIVVPVYNREKLVLRTLQSIESQTYRPLHIILVDNNSTDDSLHVIWQWSRRHSAPDFHVTVCTESAKGAAAARNRGLEFVESPYVLFFDSDDTMQPKLVAAYAEYIGNNPDSDIIYTGANCHELDGRVRIMKMCRHRVLRNHIYHALLKTVGYIVRTEFLRSAGAWNPRLLGWDDWELGIRLLVATDRVVYMPGEYVDVYAQEVSITGTGFSSRPAFWENALDEADAVIYKSARKDKISLHRLIDYRRIVLAAHYAKEGDTEQAKRLYNEVMRQKKQSLRMRLLMPLVYQYVRCGGRGAATIIDCLI